MKQINLIFNDDEKKLAKGFDEEKLHQDISVLAEAAFNNNRNSAILTILEKALKLKDLKIDINGLELSAKDILSKANTGQEDTGKKLTEVVYPLKADFRKNFYLLDLKMQKALLHFLDDLKQRHQCSYGTAANISVYIGPKDNKELCFYINISGKRGDMAIDKYLNNLSEFNDFKQRSNEGRNGRNTIWISKRDQFVRSFKYNYQVSEQFFIKALSLLHIPTDIDAVELTAEDIQSLVGKI